MLYGRRLDQALEHVEDSRYALVHAVSKRARQITLWLTADPTELRAEAAPPPSASDIISRDPIALAENEIISGEVQVRWDPHGRADELDLPEGLLVPADPLLLDSLGDDDDFDLDGDGDDSPVTPALAEVLDTDSVDTSDNPGAFVAITPHRQIIFTSALLADWRPAHQPWMPMTAIFTLEAQGEGTRYTATAMHPDKATCASHAQMGFNEGWTTAMNQLAELVEGS